MASASHRVICGGGPCRSQGRIHRQRGAGRVTRKSGQAMPLGRHCCRAAFGFGCTAFSRSSISASQHSLARMGRPAGRGSRRPSAILGRALHQWHRTTARPGAQWSSGCRPDSSPASPSPSCRPDAACPCALGAGFRPPKIPPAGSQACAPAWSEQSRANGAGSQPGRRRRQCVWPASRAWLFSSQPHPGSAQPDSRTPRTGPTPPRTRHTLRVRNAGNGAMDLPPHSGGRAAVTAGFVPLLLLRVRAHPRTTRHRPPGEKQV